MEKLVDSHCAAPSHVDLKIKKNFFFAYIVFYTVSDSGRSGFILNQVGGTTGQKHQAMVDRTLGWTNLWVSLVTELLGGQQGRD